MLKDRAFTLIELLVVIAVIAIVAAILFPVFAKVRERGRATVCMSNIKQIDLSLLQYIQDSDETFPAGYQGYQGLGEGWIGQIYPYIKSNKVFACPDDSTLNATSSYGLNANLCGSASNPTGKVAPPLYGKFANPSITVSLFEVVGNSWVGRPGYAPSEEEATQTTNSPGGFGDGLDPYQPGGAGDGLLNGTLTPPDRSLLYATGILYGEDTNVGNDPGSGKYNGYAGKMGVHSEGSNFGFIDGHVKWLRGENVYPGVDTAGVTFHSSDWTADPSNWCGKTEASQGAGKGSAMAASCARAPAGIKATFGWE